MLELDRLPVVVTVKKRPDEGGMKVRERDPKPQTLFLNRTFKMLKDRFSNRKSSLFRGAILHYHRHSIPRDASERCFLFPSVSLYTCTYRLTRGMLYWRIAPEK